MGQSDQGIQASRQRYQAVPRVLVFLRHGSDVLLLKGAPDKRLWANLYNGVGGHVEAGEDVLTAARREVLEETGIELADLRLVAVATIEAGDPRLGILLFVFTGWSPSRHTAASIEGSLHWVAAAEVPHLELVEDLAWLLPRILALPPGAPALFLHYTYDDQDRLLIHEAHRPQRSEG
jgi:8-oxo-dGTP diphosphatase